MIWNCNKKNGICNGEPDWETPPIEIGPGKFKTGGICKLDPETCERFIPRSKVYRDIIEKDKITSQFSHTITSPDGTVKKQQNKKGKSKNEKKPAGEQGSMF